MATNNNKNRPVESTRDTEDRPECVLILLMMLENPSRVFVLVGFYSTLGVDGQSRFILRSRRA